jgi:exopolyphosphatase/guanosine-5'-triphosphate,3'-diphosphate pyrophosphatase
MAEKALTAVINCGSHTIRLIVAEYGGEARIQIVDTAIQYIGLGRDVFSTGFIRKKTMQQAIEVFLQFREMLAGWHIKPAEVRVIGTSAFREAKNRDAFVDRIEVRTGFQVAVVDGLEENRLTFLAVQHSLGEDFKRLHRVNSIIMEVGAGTTEIMLMRRGQMAAVHSLSFGAVRLDEQFRGSHSTLGIPTDTLNQNLRPLKDLLASEIKTSSIREFVAVGNYAKIAADHIGESFNERTRTIARKDLELLSEKVHQLTPEECADELGISILGLPGLANALQAYCRFLQGTSAKEILVPMGGNAEGLLMEQGSFLDPEIEERFNEQVIASAISLGKKYHFDFAHSMLVARLSLSLFDQLQNEHQMKEKARVLLHVAAILHDVGTYIRSSGHHKHGMYLVLNSEIFGLSPRDVRIVANVVRYHRKSMPSPGHTNFNSLNRSDRIRVLKLASILRVADAMDRSHSQKVSQLMARRKDEELILETDFSGDLSAERFSLMNKGLMFEEVFGLRVVLLN